MAAKNPRSRNLVFLTFQHQTAVISRASSRSPCFPYSSKQCLRCSSLIFKVLFSFIKSFSTKKTANDALMKFPFSSSLLNSCCYGNLSLLLKNASPNCLSFRLFQYKYTRNQHDILTKTKLRPFTKTKSFFFFLLICYLL